MSQPINPAELKDVVTDGGEFALLDVRERGHYAAGHLYLAINTPLSSFELVMRARVPRLATRVIVCDDNESLADRAAQILERAGYSSVSTLQGPIAACETAGFQIFEGHYTTTYALGLHTAALNNTPEISAQTLKTKMDAGEDFIVVDTRTFEEFHQGCVPGAHSVPMAELLYRVKDLAPDPKTRVVVNCGAVARGVLGGQSLIEAVVDNPVSVLTNGARGWNMAGFPLEQGSQRSYSAVSDNARDWAGAAAGKLSATGAVHYITPAELEGWRSQREDRTLYLVDVRSFEEYAAGHIEDAIWIPGGELVGLYEDHLATMNARLCLVDDNGARATLTASWLNRMGWPDVAVLVGGLNQSELIVGVPAGHTPELDAIDVPSVTPSDLRARISKNQVLVIDVGNSCDYQTGHVPGAWWACRSKLRAKLCDLPRAEGLVLTSADGRVGKLAAGDIADSVDVPVMNLSGGTAAWKAEGYESVAGLTRILGELEDLHPGFGKRPGDDQATIVAAQQRMTDWQNGLLAKIEKDATFSFPR